jgi:uncharacterized protein YjbJ (UPF0337 family)
MKWYELAGDWTQFARMVKAKWAKLTDEDMTTFSGKSDQLAGLLQLRYGYGRDQAEKEISEFSTEKESRHAPGVQ